MVEHLPVRERPPRPSWLSIREAAERLDVSERTIRNWISSSHLRAQRVGPRLIRIPASELDRVGTPVGAVSP